jgi:hypothetical protein
MLDETKKCQETIESELKEQEEHFSDERKLKDGQIQELLDKN